jgi:uncharacterized membrane protein
LLLAGVAAAGLLAVPAQAAAAPGCRPVDLAAPAGSLTSVEGGDPTGTYLVGRVSYPDRTAGALWRHGRFSEIDASSLGGVQVSYHDVNRYGVVVGERMTDYGSFHTDAFTYRDGTFTFLPPLRAGDSTDALGINGRGDVVGNSSGTPVVWPAGGGVLALPGDGRAMGIDEDGTVVGYLAPYPPGTPYVWPATGAPHALPVPAGSIGGDAVAIQGSMVAGNVYDPATNSTVPTLWNLRTGGVTLHSAAPGAALSVNRWGTIGTVGAIVHRDGRVSAVGPLDRVPVVTDLGVAAGTVTDSPFGDGQAVRWFGC